MSRRSAGRRNDQSPPDIRVMIGMGGETTIMMVDDEDDTTAMNGTGDDLTTTTDKMVDIEGLKTMRGAITREEIGEEVPGRARELQG